jgi:hypothetical protein
VVVWPLKLLVVMMHESGHAIATWLVGGEVDSVTIALDQSGQCLSRLPDSFFGKLMVYSAGYVGSAVAGALLLLFTFRFRARRWILGAACVWLAVFGLIYAGDLFTRVFCLGTAALVGLGARYLPEGAVDGVNLFLAAFSGLYVVFDLRDDLWDHSVRAYSDAALLSQVTLVPALFSALVWSVFSLAVLGGAAWVSLRRERRRRPATSPF